MERVMTLSEFDKEVSTAFVTDTFLLKRLDGLLDCKSLWNKWLSYEQYGTTRINSAQAARQGGRAQEPMCLHFFMGDSEFPGEVLMKYKYRESDPHFMPYDHEGIPVLSDDALAEPDLLVAPRTVEPKAWPDKDAICKYLTSHQDLTPAQRQEWSDFFDNVPEKAVDIPESKKFKWLLPELAKNFKLKRNSPSSEGQRVGESTCPELPDERVIWSKYTRAEFNRDQKQREANYAKEQHALRERIRSEKLAGEETQELSASSSEGDSKSSNDASSSQSDSGDLISNSGGGSDSDADADNDNKTHDENKSNKRKRPSAAAVGPSKSKNNVLEISVGDSGVVCLGDFVLFNPDSESRAVDRANGYKLGMCMGKVIEINGRTKRVHLWWMFGKDWSYKAKWQLWRAPGSSRQYTDWVDASSLLVSSYGSLAKMSLTPQKREQFMIDQESAKTIKDVIGTDD